MGVFSFARYDPRTDGVSEFSGDLDDARRTVLRRSCKVLAHEVGHLFGMSHCIYFACVMNLANSATVTGNSSMRKLETHTSA